MYATIEPRLIALLNNDVPSESYPTSPSLELPPLHDPNILKASGRPLLLEPDASKRNGKPTPSSKLAPQHGALAASIDEEENTHKSIDRQQKAGEGAVDRALGSSSPQSLRKILGDGHETNTIVPSKKRHIAENGKDDFVQLPQPPKKQKAAKQVVPPIIIGLFEPPPQAALFPPIASSSFHDSHGRNSLNTVPPKVKDVKEDSKDGSSKDIEKKRPTAKDSCKRRDVRVRKKWTEEETNNLLLGVHKHGVGHWTDILEDLSFQFNERSGADLKDRFRTCCPAELRGKNSTSLQLLDKKSKSTSSLMSENILIEEGEGSVGVAGGDVSATKHRKSRTHRKRLEDLAQLGIDGPFRKSLRRERRPFSEDEDRQILEGYNLHGPAWTRIQRDSRFNLRSRQPTDLRDRFRNKYPEKFRTDDKGKENPLISVSQSSTDSQSSGSKENETLVASASQSLTNLQSLEQDVDGRGRNASGKQNSTGSTVNTLSSLKPSSSREGLRIREIISSQSPSKVPVFQPQSSLFTFKDSFTFPEQPNLESTDSMPFTQSFDWGGTIAAPFVSNMGEMDISRLLLDEPWSEMPISTGKEKQSFTEISSIITSNTESNGQSYYHMLGEAEQIVDLQDSTFE